MSCNSPSPSTEGLSVLRWGQPDKRSEAERVSGLPRRRVLTGSLALAASWVGAPAQATGLATGTAATPAAPTGREPLTHQGTMLWPRGEGQLRFFGLNIYTARLWTADGFDAAHHARHPLALELTYARTFSARDIAERSLQEMKRQTLVNQAVEADWTQKLAAVLPDVKPGDRLMGFHRPAQGALFQAGGRTLGAVDDPVFSALFFGIWLSPVTSEPALRTALIAQR